MALTTSGTQLARAANASIARSVATLAPVITSEADQPNYHSIRPGHCGLIKGH